MNKQKKQKQTTAQKNFANNVEETALLIAKHFNPKQLKLRTRQQLNALLELGTVTGKPGEQHAFIDNGADILVVAHCDTVIREHFFSTIDGNHGTKLIFCPQLDDRLGVYTALDLLPSMGIKVDILLTENEETGASTAGDFKTEKIYNWIVEFDRNGTDVVTYEYDCESILEPYFEIGNGTFSDISRLNKLGCQAFNVGVAYYDEHHLNSYMDVWAYIKQIARFVLFWTDYRDTFLKYKAIKFAGYTDIKTFGEFDWYHWDDSPEALFECKHCGFDDLTVDETYTIEGVEDKRFCVHCGEHEATIIYSP